MHLPREGSSRLARAIGPALFLLTAAGLPGAGTAQAAAVDDHEAARAALADLRAAVAEIVQVDRTFATDRLVYRRASQRAINALVGMHGASYAADAGLPAGADAEGAIGHVDQLLDRKEAPAWAEPLRGAEANLRAAVAHLEDSRKARELMDYAIAVSRALTYLEVAQGRPTETGVLGGIEGALSNTLLGVPAGATQADGCAAPTATPSYGTHAGYLAWVALPATSGTHALAEAPGGADLVVQDDMIVLHTAAAPLVATACASRVQAAPPSALVEPAAAAAPAPAPAAASGSAPPALYTVAQAQAGAAIYASKCVSCHGADLHGTAAPSVAGTDFLDTAKHNGWTLQIIRYLVVNNMPRNSPKSLSPTEYASVLAFLLASNCYPAGGTPFPTKDEPAFGKIVMGPVPGAHPDRNDLGVCKVGG